MKDITTSFAISTLAQCAKPIFENVTGAPFRIGDLVRAVQILDSTGNRTLLGKIGTIRYFEYSCGCGQTFPADPMIGVLIGETTHEFWKEELFSVFPAENLS
jgi:hypothetical protein